MNEAVARTCERPESTSRERLKLAQTVSGEAADQAGRRFIFGYVRWMYMSSISAVRSMDPYDFEKLVAKVWSSKGYNTNVRKGSNDKGVDVEATSGNHKILIQAKRYAANNKIGGPDVRKYATLYQQDPAANQIIIVTTSSFTSQAKEIAAEQNITIIDGSRFIDMIKKNNIQLNKSGQKTNTSPNISDETNNKYFDECPHCGGSNVWAKRISGRLIIKCSNCESRWKKQKTSKNTVKWKGISGEVQGKLRTTDEWTHYSTDTKFQKHKSSPTESRSDKTVGDPGFFEKLAAFPIMILLLSILHSLLSWSFYLYQIWLIIFTVIILFAGTFVKVWKSNQ